MATSWTLVTGGAKRLGAAICLELAHKGHSIVVHYRSSLKEAESIVQQCRKIGVEAESIAGNFSNSNETNAFLENYLNRFPNTANVVHNVGHYFILPAFETSSLQWQEMFQVNVFSPIAITEALLPSIKTFQGGIVNIGTSGLNGMRPDNYASAYKASKQSLWFLTKTWAQALAPFHVRVNMVSPGVLDITVDPPKNPQSLPMQRMGTPEETARAVAFLLDPQNSYITGQNIEVAGAVGL